MKLYRFSPIQDEQQLIKAVEHIHFGCFELCKQSTGNYLPVAGTIGVFCHYDQEYEFLTQLQAKMVDFSSSVNGKYFKLLDPFIISAKGEVTEATYTHFYVRKPDPYRHHVGDADFYIEPKEFSELKKSLQEGNLMNGARVIPNRPDLDLVELFDPDIDVLGYIGDQRWIDLSGRGSHK